MKITSIFEKDIERQIDGVIKADDIDALQKEVEEYVVTDEVKKSLAQFFDAYNYYGNSNGVWISGFFGSGKSHLLKMLSCLLENAPFKEKTPLEFFLDKYNEKYDDDVMDRENLKKAAGIPSRSILFNIDQKAPVGNKSETDAILAVFMKVFDEMCGYYGKQGYIAQFERDLDNKNIYDDFKSAYYNISEKKWELGREQTILESKNIAAAYSEVTGQPEDSVKGIISQYRSDYNLSIEDFAELINDYIEKQDKGFRLNFFVDEVGQYIAGNIKLMTNLQTIAESLATKCNGQAWIIVTAQEDMNKIVGEMNNQQKNDFSKIQARFANRIKLTSKNVNEVIQKRLLLKNQQGREALSSIYSDQSDNFRTLFDFADGSHVYPNFKDLSDFENCYPFIPYQFSLFQAAIEALSLHNAFEGKYSSVGERSMLSVFQEVAKTFRDTEVGGLSTFDMMFEGIRNTLTSSVYRSISNAEKGVENLFAVKLLKALFLVKYVKEFKSTIRNLCILLHSRFDISLPDLKNEVETALNFLEQQTYIQRNGEEYEYLTNEEKDVENEIKNIEIDQLVLSDELKKLLFGSVIKFGSKIRYAGNKQDYSFSHKMDDKIYGKEYELSVHIVTPVNANIDKVDVLRNQSMGRDELLVVMPADRRLMQDLLLYLQTAKYIRQATSHAQSGLKERILTEKANQNKNRINDLEVYAGELLSKARMFINTEELTVSSGDPQNAIIEAFQHLIERVYTNLQMLPNAGYTENDIVSSLKRNSTDDMMDGQVEIPSAEREVLNFTNMNKRDGVRTTVKSLCDKFESKPYGWYRWAVLCVLAKLCARGKIEVRSDGNILEAEEIEKVLKNSHTYANIMLDPQVEFSQAKIRALKDFYEDFFKDTVGINEARSLATEVKKAFEGLVVELESMKVKYRGLPFVSELSKVSGKLHEFCGKSYEWYLDDLAKYEDELFDIREKILDPIEQFIGSSQCEIFMSILQYMRDNRDNFDGIAGKEIEFLDNFIKDPQCYIGSKVRYAKEKFEVLQESIRDRVDGEIKAAGTLLNKLEDQIKSMPEYSKLAENELHEVNRHFEEFKGSIGNHNLIAVIRDKTRRFEDVVIPSILTKMTSSKSKGEGSDSVAGSSASAYISVRTLDAGFAKPYLGDENDVDTYLSALRRVILDEINNGKRVQV